MSSEVTMRTMMLALPLTLAGCGETSAGDGGTNGATPGSAAHARFDEFHDLALEQRAEIERALEAQLDSAREALAEMSRAAKKEGAQGRERVAEQLRHEEELARAKLADLRAAGADTWQRLCRETQDESRRLADQAQALFKDG